MAIPLSTIEKRLVSRVRADVSAPSTSDLNNLHQNVIAEWANEVAPQVVQLVKAPSHFQALMVFDTSLTLTSGNASLPSSPVVERVTGVKTGSSRRRTQFTFDTDEFDRFDSHNFATTPTTALPVAFVGNGKLYVKPTSITEAYIDYIKVHPTISTSQATVWSALADQVLVALLAAKYFEFRNHLDLAQMAMAKASGLAP